MAAESVAPASAAEPLVVLVSTRAVLTLPDESLVVSPATICVSPVTGKIISIVSSILPRSTFPPSATYVDHSPKLLLPGLVDAHVHLNEPGRTEWEGFNTGTRAAASGGVTTVVDMPLNAIPPTTTLAGFKEKLRAAQGQCWVDVGFYGGVIPGNADELLPLVEAGVRGFKGFLIESGVEEFPAVSSTDIALAMETLKDTPTTLMFHAEMIPPISDSVGDDVQKSCPPLAPTGELSSYRTFLDSRPPSFETYAISEIVSLAHAAPDLHLHIVHLSATQAIPVLRAARASGVNITAETCFHYLGLAAEAVADGDTRHKCCPPIREQTNQDGLWAELVAGADGVIRTVVSDHSPCTPELKLLPSRLEHRHSRGGRAEDEGYDCGCSSDEDHSSDDGPAAASKPKLQHNDSGVDVRPAPGGQDGEATLSRQVVVAAAAAAAADEEEEARASEARASEAARGDFFAAWGGISSVGLGLPILHTAAGERAAAGEHVPSVTDMVRLCSQATARQVGLAHRKGGLRVGLDADVCVFDDAEKWTLRTGDMRWRNRVSPWEGKRFVGRVRETWVRGRKVFELGAGERGFVCGKPLGEPIVERRVV